MKIVLTAAVGVVLIALAAFLWRNPSRSTPLVPENRHETPAAPSGGQLEAPAEPAPGAEVALPSVEPPRHAVPHPSVPSQTEPGPTVVRLRLLSSYDETPVVGERVALSDARATSLGWRAIQGSRARLDEAPLTDIEGRADLEVKPGAPLRVQIASRWPEETEIPALTEGEQRDVLLRVPILSNYVVHGRLVDAESGLPLAGSVVQLESVEGLDSLRVGDEIEAHADGTFAVLVRSSENNGARASADGYARADIRLAPTHATPGQALEVRLSRAAALEVLVLDGLAPLAGANVELKTDAYHLEQNNDLWSSFIGEEPVWTAESDVSGVAGLADLPPRVPLQLAVQPRGGPQRIEAEPIILEVGERRRIEIRLGSGSAIMGRVEDGERQPVVDLEVWRIAARWPVPARIPSFLEPAARTRTDAGGRFRFEDVPPGAWHVGPPFDELLDESEKTADAIVGLAQHVQVEPGSDLHEVVIQVDRGLYLSGTVLDSDGRPAPTVSVSATATQVLDYSGGYTDEAGRFRIGPLCAGVYVMEADGAGQHAPSQRVAARAGDSNLVLHLRVGGTIRGRTSDAAGRPQRCEVLLAGEGEEHWVLRLSEGTFSFDGLSPGTYALAARSADGLCGRRAGLVLRAGQTLEGVDLVLEQGARLRVGFTGQDHCGYEIRVDGVAFFADALERGTEKTVAVPVGEIEVRWSNLDGSIQKTQRLTLAQGEERSIGWDGKP